MELFERLAYYGQQIVFMIYLRNRLGFTEAEAGTLSGIFGGLIYLLPILAGTLADKWGFRRAFTIAFSILALGYFLIGSIGMSRVCRDLRRISRRTGCCCRFSSSRPSADRSSSRRCWEPLR